MLSKKQLIFAAFAILASKIAKTRAKAYKPDVDEGGYFTPYFPTDWYDGSGSEATASPTWTEQEEQPSPTAPPAADNTPYSDEDIDTSAEVASSTMSTSIRVKPTSPPDNKQYTPVTETLSDGSSYQKGSFNSSLRWQSTGILKHGTLLVG